MAPIFSRLLQICSRQSKCFRRTKIQYLQVARRSSGKKLGKPGEFRMDKDTLGEVKVPAEKYFGSETMRSITNFPSGGDNERMPFPLISAIGIIKKAAAMANMEYGLDSKIAEAIVQAAEEVMCGEHYCEHFPIVIWQAGAMTNSHINTNEVIANRAIEILGGKIGSKVPVHPNDHVNMGQSTNDVIPSAIHICLALEIHNNTLPGIKCFHEELERKASEWQDIIKVGRTHLMDAVPISLGQEFCGYACQVKDGINRIEATLPGLYQLMMGGTAVGTQLNAACGYAEKVACNISEVTGLPFVTNPSKIAGCACLDHVVNVSAALSTLSCSLMKIVNDIRHMSSGPRCGIYELLIPEKEPGSSIMPGKVNPTQCEAVLNIAALTIGNHAATTVGGGLGNWELNLYKPLIFHNTFRSCRLIGHVCKAFTKNCLKDTCPNEERICEMLDKCLMLVTALNPHIGYDRAAKIAVLAHAEGLSLKEAALKKGVSEEDFDKWVKPEDMIKCMKVSKSKGKKVCGKKKEKKVCGKEKKEKKVCGKKKDVCGKKKKKSVCGKPKKGSCGKLELTDEKKRMSKCNKPKKNKQKKAKPCGGGGKSVCGKKKKEKKDICGKKKKKSGSTCGKKKSDSTCGKKKSDSTCGKKKSDSTCGKKKSDSTCGKKKSDSTCGKKKSDSTCGKKKSDSTCGKKKSDSTCGKKKSDSSCGSKKKKEDKDKCGSKKKKGKCD